MKLTHVRSHLYFLYLIATRELAERTHATMCKKKLNDDIQRQRRAINIVESDFADFQPIVDLTQDDEEVRNVPKTIVVEDIHLNEGAPPALELQFDSLAGNQYGFWIEVSSFSFDEPRYSLHPKPNIK